MAIEFVSFPKRFETFPLIEGKDSLLYMAFVLDKKMANPQLVILNYGFVNKYFNISEKSLHNTSLLIWGNLIKYIKGKKNVYFAPSGELYNIPIETLPLYWHKDSIMTDKWHMYRLSSTRELAFDKKQNTCKRAALYGGIDYDAGIEVLIADSKRFSEKRALGDMLTYAIADSLNLRDYAKELPETKIEVEEIDKSLKQNRIATNLRMGTLATEGDFKNLSGKNINLIHVATHGFYWADSEAEKRMRKDNMPSKSVEDKALARSGLLFAGANNVPRGIELPDSVNDGILTAKEISQLDLRGLDLVVLSACQTGCGDVTAEGVFGLQRGFKKAGAKTILMSLWEVDDEATQLLMTVFYKNYCQGIDKNESLRLAQKAVREERDKGGNLKFDAPYYWAGFVMLD